MSRCIVPSAAKSPPARRTTTSYAVLGLLCVTRWTTYELAKQVQRSLNWFWPRAERKIYDEPKTLAAEGLATASKEFTGQRPRTVYDITPSGRAALREWLDEPSAPYSWESEAMLKVFFADAGSVEQLQTVITELETDAATRLDALAAMVAEQLESGSRFPARRHLNAVAMRLQYDQEAAILRWSRWAREQVADWAGTADPGGWDESAVLRQIVADHRTLS